MSVNASPSVMKSTAALFSGLAANRTVRRKIYAMSLVFGMAACNPPRYEQHAPTAGQPPFRTVAGMQCVDSELEYFPLQEKAAMTCLHPGLEYATGYIMTQVGDTLNPGNSYDLSNARHADIFNRQVERLRRAEDRLEARARRREPDIVEDVFDPVLGIPEGVSRRGAPTLERELSQQIRRGIENIFD